MSEPEVREARAHGRREEVERARDRGTRSRRRVETRPFLLLTIRAERAAADNEYESFLRFTGLDPAELPRVDLGAEQLPEFSRDDWSGVILGGGPWNASDPESTKSAAQLRAEKSLTALLDDLVLADFPFLGCCYGVGTLGIHQGGVVDRRHPEPVGPLAVRLTAEGEADPLFAGVPRAFAAYGGHKEAIGELPRGAVSLATSDACPVQAFRVGSNVYATQFHPELDLEGVCTRIDVYKDAGYFPPEDAEAQKELSRSVEVTHPMTVLQNFVERYRR